MDILIIQTHRQTNIPMHIQSSTTRGIYVFPCPFIHFVHSFYPFHDIFYFKLLNYQTIDMATSEYANVYRLLEYAKEGRNAYGSAYRKWDSCTYNLRHRKMES